MFLVSGLMHTVDMPLYQLGESSLKAVPASSLVDEHVKERTDLQRILRQQADVLVDDVLIVAEEFTLPFDTRRRVDLLGIDHEGHLVVIELKRTNDGGHLELQALRYAAMVSALTFDDIAMAFENYLARTQPASADQARSQLTEWITDAEGDDIVLDREVRIVLASGDFDPEITTTVLWLNDVYGLDIRCLRMTPYRVGEKLLLDVQPIIPLPEAAEITVRLRRRGNRVRAAKGGADWTPYIIVTPRGQTKPLRKRYAILELVTEMHRGGIAGEELASVLPHSRFLSVEGQLTGEDLAHVFVESYPNAEGNLNRWFLESPIHDPDCTWVLSKMWGTSTQDTLDALVSLDPDGKYSYIPSPKSGT